jgi:diketogulonate reductase-like aldo/keto reductase
VPAVLKAGCRHLDLAHVYGNETGVPLKQVFEKGIVKREERSYTCSTLRAELL